MNDTHVSVDYESDDHGCDESHDVGDHVGDAHHAAGVVGGQVHAIDLKIVQAMKWCIMNIFCMFKVWRKITSCFILQLPLQHKFILSEVKVLNLWNVA